MDQLKDGLSELGVQEAMAKHTDILQPFFTSVGSSTLTASMSTNCMHTCTFSDAIIEHSCGQVSYTCKSLHPCVLFSDMIKQMFRNIQYSPTGSTDRTKEEATYMLFLDLLYYCEGMYVCTCACTCMVLVC